MPTPGIVMAGQRRAFTGPEDEDISLAYGALAMLNPTMGASKSPEGYREVTNSPLPAFMPAWHGSEEGVRFRTGGFAATGLNTIHYAPGNYDSNTINHERRHMAQDLPHQNARTLVNLFSQPEKSVWESSPRELDAIHYADIEDEKRRQAWLRRRRNETYEEVMADPEALARYIRPPKWLSERLRRNKFLGDEYPVDEGHIGLGGRFDEWADK